MTQIHHIVLVSKNQHRLAKIINRDLGNDIVTNYFSSGLALIHITGHEVELEEGAKNHSSKAAKEMLWKHYNSPHPLMP
jgi:hypothetical protein